MKRIIALGFFDGVHLGHGALLRRTVELAAEYDAAPSVLSFDAPPVKSVELINSPHDRADIIKRQYGISDMIFLHFDEALRRMPWEEFTDRLVSDFGAVHLVAGYDFRFGYMGAGDAEKLRERCALLGVGCDIVGRVELEGGVVSSTRIRALLKNGEIEAANRLLGHPFFLTDTVHNGFRLGRTMGFPTVNMRFESGVMAPKYGVYAGKAYILTTGEVYGCVTNIGVRPTVGGTDAVSVESYLKGFSGNLYGERLRVELSSFIRPETKFASVDELREQIKRDAEYC